jgi:hypothetical protein
MHRKVEETSYTQLWQERESAEDIKHTLCAFFEEDLQGYVARKPSYG